MTCFRPLSGDYLLFHTLKLITVLVLACFRPLSGDYLLFKQVTCNIKGTDVTLFPSPVGGLSLIQKVGLRTRFKMWKVSVPCRGIISYSKCWKEEGRREEKGFRPLSGDYLLFLKHRIKTLRYTMRKCFRPLSGDYLLFKMEKTLSYVSKYAKVFPSPVGGLSLIPWVNKNSSKYATSFRPLSGDYLLFDFTIHYLCQFVNTFPSPVGGLSLIRTRNNFKRAIEEGFRPLSGDYLLFKKLNCWNSLWYKSFRPLSGDYLLFRLIKVTLISL